MSIAAVPAPIEEVAPVPMDEAEIEDAARDEFKRAIGLVVDVRAPTWRHVMMSGHPISFVPPNVPPGAATAIDGLKKESFSPDATGLAALAIAERLQKAKPQGSYRRSIAPARPTSPPRGASDDWDRSVFLSAAGPACISLLVASRYLLPSDVEFFAATYPKGLEAQRLGAVEAATAITQAGARTGIDPDLPEWLDRQLFTLLDEESAADVFQALYASQPNDQQNQPPPPSGGRAGIAESFRPTPGTGDSNR